MKKHIVVINQISPEDTNVISPFPAVLKNYLGCQHQEANIIYWNTKLMDLQRSFVWENYSDIRCDEGKFSLLFYNYLALKEADDKALINIEAKLMSLKPNQMTSEVAFFHKHMKVYAQRLDEILTECIEEIYSDERSIFFFFVDNKYKWICASIIAGKIKQQHPESIVIVGGLDNKNTAAGYLHKFSQFDFAIWGEVEKTMLDLCGYLAKENKAYKNIPNLVFRKDNVVSIASCPPKKCVFLADQALRADYSDFFEQQGDTIATVPVLGIEIDRNGRRKPVQAIVNEISYFINEYHIYAFHFPIYEITGDNHAEFNELLDALLLIKEQFPDFSISLFPVVARTVSTTTLYRMMLAGFYSIQINYISASENLLSKSKSESSFADNLLLVKFASLYNIILTEADVLIGIPGEADEDILQAISNLYYLRFFFKSGQLRHRLKKVEVTSNDSCYNQVRKDSKNWDIDPSLKRFLPSDYVKSQDKNINIFNFIPVQSNPLWGDFKQAETYFLQNRFEYKLYRKAYDAVLYKELFNNNVVNEFELDEIDWFILKKANAKVISIEFLMKEIRDKIKNEFMDIEIINTLENLKLEKLIYLSDDYKEIVSVINTELIV